MTSETFRLNLTATAKCVLKKGAEEWRCTSTLEALERARAHLRGKRGRMEIYDETGQRFMVVPV